MTLFRAVLFALLLSAAAHSQAAPDAVVEGIQLPAWVTRDGKRQPLVIGSELRSNDEVSTGGNSRLLLRLADGSVVKLGENGRLQLADVVQRRKENFLGATLRVLAGAFRFTTDAALKARTSRDIVVQFPTITAGIRGTDIWGKNLDDKEVIVLIEGEISVTRSGGHPVQMKDPLTYMQAPREGEATVQAVPMEQLTLWAAETEIAAGQGAVRKDGKWKLYLGSFERQADALALYDSLRGDGYPARIQPQPREGGQIYRVRLAGFASEQEAMALGARLKESHPGIEPAASRQ
ncbi:MAG TPA: SPOR domain-containing protein [Burkholderiales bacterium]|nr:SPOR domain-containing protein [Burkholderiales bacterium]